MNVIYTTFKVEGVCKTSLDEFPQFFNILKRDMRHIGIRLLTKLKFFQYWGIHKKRLALKASFAGLL